MRTLPTATKVAACTIAKSDMRLLFPQDESMSLMFHDLAPDCTFLRTDGTSVRLSDFLGKPVVLIFLRHLA